MNEDVAIDLLTRCRQFLRDTRDKLGVVDAVESACLGLDITEALDERWIPRKAVVPWGRPP